MAAPRKYSNTQRAAMYALYEQGVQPGEIAKRCGEGLASVAPFEIPRKSCEAIVKAMARERGLRAVNSVEDAEAASEIEACDIRIRRLLKRELDRFESKQRGRGLSLDDLERLERIEKIQASREKRTRTRSKSPPPRKAPEQQQRAGFLEGLARDEAERPEAADQRDSSNGGGSIPDTHTRPHEAPNRDLTGVR